ncbi:UNVERIFIED_CONTAM: hypothetical protein Slati_2120100 [Sesamum latifolium]|uniref:Uncharacterized protein n=1 Tax=Sesamum latifolium TaxID=2727402 RepID=A0AAW2WPQ1_9LAMI
MVVALGPGKFYGSSLPRPRFYTDVKLNDERVDPPLPVMDPLMAWAQEAHWSMGGLSFKRHRLQGRIEAKSRSSGRSGRACLRSLKSKRKAPRVQLLLGLMRIRKAAELATPRLRRRLRWRLRGGGLLGWWMNWRRRRRSPGRGDP